MNKKVSQKKLTELIKMVQAKVTEAGILDELVHDTASATASNVNNEGIESQVKYLVNNYGLEGAIKTIEEASNDLSHSIE
jgi:hypothetical protein